ncbi:hypothetical protein JW992_15200 [candidate division KSB1 bacterium]|nr:hypothetical protein [candidate division KSB1 bacterium]
MSESTNLQPSYKQDRLNGFILGVIFILAGSLIFADQHNWLQAGWFWWLIFLVGIVFLLESVVRLALPNYRHPSLTRIIWGPILIAVGGGKIIYLQNWWPLILIVTGVLLVISSIRKLEN